MYTFPVKILGSVQIKSATSHSSTKWNSNQRNPPRNWKPHLDLPKQKITLLQILGSLRQLENLSEPLRLSVLQDYVYTNHLQPDEEEGQGRVTRTQHPRCGRGATTKQYSSTGTNAHVAEPTWAIIRTESCEIDTLSGALVALEARSRGQGLCSQNGVGRMEIKVLWE